jgi:hypothetical protein
MTAVQGEDDKVGGVSQVHGNCWLQRGNARPKLITLKESGGEGLHGGNKVRCDAGGSMVLELTNGKTTIDPSEPNQWTTIPRITTRRRDGMAEPVDDWFRIGGSLRAGFGSIYSPPNGGYGSAIWLQHFGSVGAHARARKAFR